MSAIFLTRRQALVRALAMGAAASVPAWIPRLAGAAECQITPAQPEGPFYMGGDLPSAEMPANDLTRIPGAPRPAEGEVIRVAGRVLDGQCRPLPGVRVEIWQSCVTGRYAHQRDENPARMDPYFRYFGHSVSDGEGNYAFKTIKPGQYPISRTQMRPSHIHFMANYQGQPLLTTQMYFDGDQYNKSDILLSRIPRSKQQALIVSPETDSESGLRNHYSFDLSLSMS